MLAGRDRARSHHSCCRSSATIASAWRTSSIGDAPYREASQGRKALVTDSRCISTAPGGSLPAAMAGVVDLRCVEYVRCSAWIHTPVSSLRGCGPTTGGCNSRGIAQPPENKRCSLSTVWLLTSDLCQLCSSAKQDMFATGALRCCTCATIAAADGGDAGAASSGDGSSLSAANCRVVRC